LESRIAYLKIALQLRHSTDVIKDKLHPHSYLSKKIALAMIESEIYLKTNLSYMTAWAALSSHARLEIKTSLQGFAKVFQSAKNAVPYMQSLAAGAVDEDTQRLIEKWKIMDKEGKLDSTK